MQSDAKTADEYIASLPDDRRLAVAKLRKTLSDNIPGGFAEIMQYGMMGYVVPHSEYPAGYHCDPKLPLPFLGMASQKNSVNFYHMGLYADPQLLAWFKEEYPKHSSSKLDMGKSCIRLKKMDAIPYELIGELVSKMSVAGWIALYESHVKK